MKICNVKVNNNKILKDKKHDREMQKEHNVNKY